jgi:hypothetical protein
LRTTVGEGGILIQGYRALMQKEARFFELGTMSRSYNKNNGLDRYMIQQAKRDFDKKLFQTPRKIIMLHLGIGRISTVG